MGALASYVSRQWHARATASECDLDVPRIKRIWRERVATDDTFFERVYLVMVGKDANMAKVFLPPERCSSEEEKKFVLDQLAENISEFLGGIIEGEENMLEDPHKLADHCFLCGMRHAAYHNEHFKVVYWDVFVLAVTQTLEEMAKQPPAGNQQRNGANGANGNTNGQRPAATTTCRIKQHPLTCRDILAWQQFMRFVADQMRIGYERGRSVEEDMHTNALKLRSQQHHDDED